MRAGRFLRVVMNKEYTLIVAPFWHEEGHVGVLRVKRFLNWLKPSHKIIIVAAGTKTLVEEFDWGKEITIKDPLNLYERMRRNINKSDLKASLFTKLKRWLITWVFIPDFHIVWGRKVVGSELFNEYKDKIDFVISSSRPESSHVVAMKIANKTRSKFVADLRDGWFDDPLKPYLRKKNLRVLGEKIIENKVYRKADKILVTSSKWKELLVQRKPKLTEKICVLTNGYDLTKPIPKKQKNKRDELVLIHAGSFTRSRSTQKIEYLLEPILNLDSAGVIKRIQLLLIGKLKESELIEIERFNERSVETGVKIKTEEFVPKMKLYEKLAAADGFLLLSASEGAIPSKMFDYLLFRRPILTVTPEDSGLWQLTKDIPNCFLVDSITKETNYNLVREFLYKCEDENLVYDIPSQFSEESIKNVFLSCLDDTMNI